MQKAMGFASNLVSMILDGRKILTYRLGKDYDVLQPDDEIDVKDKSTGKVFGRIKIQEKTYTTFKELPIDRDGHEIYPSKGEQKRIFQQYYGDIDDNEKVIVLRFTLIK